MTKRARLRQIHRWLEKTFPAPRPTELTFFRKPHGDVGGATWAPGEPAVVLAVNTYYSSHECIMALVEEHAHAEVIARTELHTAPWGEAYWKRRHAFDDRGGDRESPRY